MSGSQVEINNFRESFERGEDPLADVTDASDINSVAGVLKLYLRELREPLFPIIYFEHFMELARECYYFVVELSLLLQPCEATFLSQLSHQHISVMELDHLLAHSGLTYPEISSKVYHDSFCQLDSSVSLPWVIYFEAFYLHVVSSLSCIPAICQKLVLFLTPLRFVHLFCNLSKCILLFFSFI